MAVDASDVVVVAVVVVADDVVVVVVDDVGGSFASWAYQVPPLHSSPQQVPYSPYHIAPGHRLALALTLLAAAVDTSFVPDSGIVVGYTA